jgi:hypothetical protein
MSQKPAVPRVIRGALLMVLLGAFFLRASMPIFDPDFWWHLATGRWMWEHGTLMAGDPFNFLSFPGEPTDRRDFILTQYWLAQLLMFGIQQVAGLWGIIALRAGLVTLMFFGLYRLLRRQEVSPALAVLLLYVACRVIVGEFSYVGDRPQLWTSLFAVVLLLLLENARDGRRWALCGVPLLMLLWANLHGGYVLGVMFIGAYLLPALFRFKARRGFVIAGAAAVVLSAVNPNGWAAFLSAAAMFVEAESLAYWQGIVESQSILTHASLGGIARRLPFLTATAGISLLSYAVYLRNWRRMRVEHALLFVLVFLMGLNSIRYIIFFVQVAALVTGTNLSQAVEPLLRRERLRRAVAWAVLPMALLVSADLGWRGLKQSAFRSGVLHVAGMAGAADYLERNGIRGNTLNHYDHGGYLLWRLHPRVMVFSDGRALSFQGFKLFDQVVNQPYAPLRPPYDMTPLYGGVSDRYNVNVAVMPGCDRVSGVTLPLSYALLTDDDWEVLYADAEAIIFMRKLPGTRAFVEARAIPRSEGYRNILSMARAALREGHAHMVPGIRFSLAIGYMGIGERQEALRWMSEYLRMVPNDARALRLLEEMRNM